MRAFLGVLLIVLACGSYLRAAGPTAKSLWANNDVELDTHPSPFWRAAARLYMETDTYGHRDPKYQTELRTRWTKQNLYFLFICPYEELNLKPDAKTSTETYELWNWDRSFHRRRLQ